MILGYRNRNPRSQPCLRILVVVYGPPITLEAAKKAAAAALAEARKNNWTMAVAIVDPGGHLVYYEKMDNTQVAGANISIDKARSAATFQTPDQSHAGHARLRRRWPAHSCRLRGAIPVEGGLPLISDGKIIGAIGLSGDSSENDGRCAQAGVRHAEIARRAETFQL